MLFFSFLRKLMAGFLMALFALFPYIKIFAKDQSSVNVYYIHQDHLNGANLVTNGSGLVDELFDYYPFGSIRLDNHLSSHNEKRKYIGQEYDAGSKLEYLNARYYDPQLGKFISQDPQFWPVPSEDTLLDPQQFNSYSYSRNNPINYSDPLGLSSATFNSMPNGGWKFGQAMGQFNNVNAYYNGTGSSRTTYSCVEYAKRYMSQQYGINSIGSVGDAKSMWEMVNTINNRLAQAGSQYNFQQHVNGSNSLPSEGDLLFWTEGQYGHVMVVTESAINKNTGQGYVEIIDQNANSQAVRRLDVKSSNGNYTITHKSGINDVPVAGWFSVESTAQKTSTTANVSAPKSSWLEQTWNKAKNFIGSLFKH